MRTRVPLCAVLLLTACMPQQKLLRHYDSYSAPEPARKEALSLSIFPANPESAEEPPFIFQLTEKAQAELIRSLTARMKLDEGNADLMAALASVPVADPDKCTWARKTTLSKRLVVNVLGDLPTPADRIDKLDIVLTLDGDNAKHAQFLSWDRFSSKYGDFNIGTAKFTQANKISAGLGRTSNSSALDKTSSLDKVFSVGYENNNSLEESASYALRRLTVGGELSPEKARLVQEGAPNYTLFGSSVATISIALPSGTLARVHAFVLAKDGTRLAPAAVTMESCLDEYPISSEPITATVSGTAQVRMVKSGAATVSEGDDEVVMVSRALQAKPVTLASAKDLFVQRFALGNCTYQGKAKPACSYVHVERDATHIGKLERVVFPSLESAAALRRWLVEQSAAGPVSTIANRRIGIADQVPGSLSDVTRSAASALVVIALPANAASAKDAAAPVH